MMPDNNNDRINFGLKCLRRDRGQPHPRRRHPGGRPPPPYPFLSSAMTSLDDGVIAVGGFGGRHRFGIVGEDRVVAVDRERLGPPRGHGLGVEGRTRRTIRRAGT